MVLCEEFKAVKLVALQLAYFKGSLAWIGRKEPLYIYIYIYKEPYGFEMSDETKSNQRS